MSLLSMIGQVVDAGNVARFAMNATIGVKTARSARSAVSHGKPPTLGPDASALPAIRPATKDTTGLRTA